MNKISPNVFMQPHQTLFRISLSAGDALLKHSIFLGVLRTSHWRSEHPNLCKLQHHCQLSLVLGNRTPSEQAFANKVMMEHLPPTGKCDDESCLCDMFAGR